MWFNLYKTDIGTCETFIMSSWNVTEKEMQDKANNFNRVINKATSGRVSDMVYSYGPLRDDPYGRRVEKDR